MSFENTGSRRHFSLTITRLN